MAYTSPTTRSTNDLITAAIWNADMVENIKWLYNGNPGCRVYHNTTQSMTGSSDNTVLFNTERYDTDTMHSTVSNTGRITVTTAGTYMFHAQIDWATAPGSNVMFLRLNGATKVASVNWTGSSDTCEITTIYAMVATDYMELLVNPATTQTINSTANYSPEFMAHRLG